MKDELKRRQDAETAALTARQAHERATFETAEWNRAVGFHRDNHGDTPVRDCLHLGCLAAYSHYRAAQFNMDERG